MEDLEQPEEQRGRKVVEVVLKFGASGPSHTGRVAAAAEGKPAMGLRIESLNKRATKLIVLANWLGLVLGTAGTAAMFVAKLASDNATALEDSSLFVGNVVCASILLALQLVGAVWMVKQVVQARRCKWSRFRTLQVVTNFAQVLSIMFILATMIASNAKPLAVGRCWMSQSGNYYLLLALLRELGWAVHFALLVVQVQSLVLVEDAAYGVKAKGLVARALRCCAATEGTSPVASAAADASQQHPAAPVDLSDMRRRSSSRKLGGPGVRLAAERPIWQYLPVLVVMAAVMTASVLGYLNDWYKLEEDRAFERAFDAYMIGIGQGVNANSREVLTGIAVAIEAANSTTIDVLETDPDRLFPLNVSLRTGIAGGTFPVHIWGGDPASEYPANRSFAWTLGDDFPAWPELDDVRRGRIFQDEEVYSQTAWALEMTFAWWWMSYIPMTFYCGGVPQMNYADVVDATIFNNELVRSTLFIGSCAEKPDQTCYPQSCPLTKSSLVFDIVFNALLFVFVLMYAFFLFKGFRSLGRHAYLRYRLPNILLAMQLREGLPVFIFFFNAFTILSYSDPNNCFARTITGMGIIPVVFVATVMAMCRCYYCSPTSTEQHTVAKQDALQKFAYVPSDYDDVVAQRGQADEPVFCFTTALKGLFWSIASYRMTEDTAADELLYCTATAMKFDDLQESRVIHHSNSDTAALAAWKPGMLVLAFRGTASITNAKTDAKAWLIVHPYIQRSNLSHRMPALVHKGFMRAWQTVREEVLELVRNVPRADDGSINLFITGHSLGGSLATLAAYDAKQALLQHDPAAAVDVRVYTFGAPRSGSHSFASVYQRAVPDTWDCVNDQDVVPKMTKWLRVYKACGKRVIINKLGDLLVRPSWIEVSIKNKMKNSADDHMLGAYGHALRSIIDAQCDLRKCLDDGPEGVSRLWGDEYASFIMRECLGLELGGAGMRETAVESASDVAADDSGLDGAEQGEAATHNA